jgi:hypothetical protein
VETQIAGAGMPTQVTGRHLLFQDPGDHSSEVWQQETDAHPQARWRAVQRDAMANETDARKDLPTVPSVRFLATVGPQLHSARGHDAGCSGGSGLDPRLGACRYCSGLAYRAEMEVVRLPIGDCRHPRATGYAISKESRWSLEGRV